MLKKPGGPTRYDSDDIPWEGDQTEPPDPTYPSPPKKPPPPGGDDETPPPGDDGPDEVEITGSVQPIPVLDTEFPDLPPQPPGGGAGGSQTDVDRRLTINSTALGGVLGPVYGKRRVNSLCMLMKKATYSSNIIFGYIYCVGESVAISNVQYPDTSVQPPWLRRSQSMLGTADSSNRPWFLTSIGYYPGFVWTCFDTDSSQLSGLPNLTALISGKKIHDFRDPAFPGDTTTNHANPALIAYDICTDVEMWKALDVTNVNLDQLTDIADWCDEDVDGEPRWHYHGRLDIRESDAALTEVLSHCRTSFYVYNRTIHFYADMPPRPLDDDWSSSGTTFSADLSGGNATTKIEAGDSILVYEGGTHYVYTIDSVTDDNEFETVETPVSPHSTIKVRPISNVFVRADDLAAPPSGSYRDPAESPDVVLVKYQNEEETDWKPIRCEDPDGYEVGNPKQTETTLNGCKTAGMAARWGHHERRGLSLRPFSFEFVAQGDVSKLQPGDVFRFDTLDGPDDLLVRLISKDEDVFTGFHSCSVTEFDMGVYSDDVADEDTLPGDYIDPVTPVVPSAVTHTFIEHGDWDDVSLIANPDNISSWPTDSALLTVSYNSTYDETRFEVTGGPHVDPYEYTYLDISDDVKASSGAMFHFLVRAIGSNHTVGNAMRIEYWAGSSHAAASQRDYRWVTPWAGTGWNDAGVSDEIYSRVAYWFPVADAAVHEIRFVFGALFDLTGIEPVYAVKRCRFVVWGQQGQPSRPQIGSASPLFKLGLAERFSWVEGSGAEDANQSYELYQGQGLQVDDKLLVSTKVGTALVEESHIRRGGTVLDLEHLAMSSGTDQVRGLYMLARSTTGHTTWFPVATQIFEGDTPPPSERYQNLYANRVFSDATDEIWRFRVFKLPTFAQGAQFHPGYILPPEKWSDYEMELWLDKTGGTNYELVASCELGVPGPGGQRMLGFGYCTDVGQLRNQSGWGNSTFFANLDSFYPTSYAEVTTARYRLKIRSKYTDKRTVMSLSNTSMMTENPPYPDRPVLVADPTFVSSSYPLPNADGTFTWVNERRFSVVWNELATYGKDDPGYFEFETRRLARPTIIERSAWRLNNGAALRASFSESGQATFPGDLPIPVGHDQFRLVVVGAMYGNEMKSNWHDIQVALSLAALATPSVDVPTDHHLAEPVIISTATGPAVVLGDNVYVTGSAPTIPTYVDQQFEFVFLDDGELVVV